MRPHSRNATISILGALALMAPQGCADSHLIYIHEATVGIHASVGADQSSKLVFGYDSETFALVPERKGSDAQGDTEAMTLLSAAKVDATGLSEIVFNHVVATGKAAQRAVKNKESLKYFRDAVFPELAKDANKP